MTYEEKVEKLKEYRIKMQTVNEMEEELEELRGGMDVRAVQLSGMPGGGPDPNRMARGMEKLERQQERLRRTEAEAEKVRDKLEGAIDEIADPRKRRILRMIYFSGMNQTDAAEKLGCCRRALNSTHRAAVDELFGEGKNM